MKLLISMILLIVILTGCYPVHPCSIDYNLTPVFIGFSSEEVDSVVVRQYAKNDKFDKLIDTGILVNFNGVIKGDTIFRYPSYGLDLEGMYGTKKTKVFSKEYDWELYYFHANRTVRISKLTIPQSEGRGTCYNLIQSFYQDTTLIFPSTIFLTEYNMYETPLYIKK